jgi:competence protein ComGC
MSVASTKFARAAFALVEVLIVVAAIVIHLAIICIVLCTPHSENQGRSTRPTAKAC